jgi:copper transport protein
MRTISNLFNHWRVLLFRIFFLALMLILAVGQFTSAQAHDVQPTKSDPAAGAVLAQSPDKVTVWFPEEVVADKSTLQVFDAQGKQVDLGKGGVDLNDASHMVMVVSLPKLAQGVYNVKWDIGLTDGDSSAGSFMFGVGNVTIPASAPQPEAGAPTAPAAKSQSSTNLIVGGVVVIVAVILLVVFWFMRRSARPKV